MPAWYMEEVRYFPGMPTCRNNISRVKTAESKAARGKGAIMKGKVRVCFCEPYMFIGVK